MTTRYWGEEGLTPKFKVLGGISGRTVQWLEKQRHRHQANHTDFRSFKKQRGLKEGAPGPVPVQPGWLLWTLAKLLYPLAFQKAVGSVVSVFERCDRLSLWFWKNLGLGSKR